jgi:hypothetical protein
MGAKRLWLTLDTIIGPVEVYVMRRLPAPYRHAFGSYDDHKRRIYIRASHPDDMKSTLLHEALHVSLGALTPQLKRRLLGSRKRSQEEVVVGWVERELYFILDRNRLLRLPSPPRLPKKKAR